MEKNELEHLLTIGWPNEANVVGKQYVKIIAKETLIGTEQIEGMFSKTEGEHAYGILEAINTLIAAGGLLVACLQLRQSIVASKEARDAIVEKLSETMTNDESEKIANHILSEE